VNDIGNHEHTNNEVNYSRKRQQKAPEIAKKNYFYEFQITRSLIIDLISIKATLSIRGSLQSVNNNQFFKLNAKMCNQRQYIEDSLTSPSYSDKIVSTSYYAVMV
jgi:hypothetical protein